MTFAPHSQASQERKEQVETAVMLTKSGQPRSLHERMADFAISGVSIAVINDYQVDWACGYGVRKMGEPGPVETETLFQACSISKAVTAMAVLRLVEEGRLDLDADVNTYLQSWKVPANGLWRPRVTIRQLLSHTAGVSVAWFAGYHRQQDIPTLREVLRGEQPSNTPEICVTTPPGLRFRYSGGGYCILQQLLMDVMQQPFPSLMRQLVLNPLAMTHSSFEQPLPDEQAKTVAVGHRANGKPVAGDWYVYPEMAAAGFWTTPSDLAQLALELQCVRAGKRHRLFSAHMVQELLTPHGRGNDNGAMGLGVFVQGVGSAARFGHPGDNTGFTSCWVSLIEGGQGCVLMTNSDNGWSLQEELLQAIAQVYAWPGLPSAEKQESGPSVEDTALFKMYVGEYELRSGLSLTISIVNQHLFLQVAGQPPLELMRQSEQVFLCLGVDDILTFMSNEQGTVQALILQQGAAETVALKRASATQKVG